MRKDVEFMSSSESDMDLFEKIEITLIKDLIPLSMFNRLQKLGVKTVGEISLLSRDDYINFTCNHPLSLGKFDGFRTLLLENPAE